jgi:hypothetical protein
MLSLTAHRPDADTQFAKIPVAFWAMISRRTPMMRFAVGVTAGRGRDPDDWRGDLFQQESDFAELQVLARKQDGFANRLSVNEGSVGGAEVLDRHSRIHDHEFAVMAGDGRVFDDEVVVGFAAQGGDARGQGDFPRALRSRIDDQASHGGINGFRFNAVNAILLSSDFSRFITFSTFTLTVPILP